jgi:hypothetical protein
MPTVDIRFCPDPVCPCCNEFMERRSLFEQEDVAHIPEGDWICRDCCEASKSQTLPLAEDV